MGIAREGLQESLEVTVFSQQGFLGQQSCFSLFSATFFYKNRATSLLQPCLTLEQIVMLASVLVSVHGEMAWIS